MFRGFIGVYLFGVSFAFAGFPAESAPNAAAVQVEIVVETKDGRPADADIDIQTPTGTKAPLSSIATSPNKILVFLEKCDSTVFIRAKPKYANQIRIKSANWREWLPCDKKGVVFNDFAYKTFYASVDDTRLTDQKLWAESLGSVVVASNPALPGEIASAFQAQEYGKIAIISKELEASIRRNKGDTEQANFLYQLSVEASAKGVLAAQNKTVPGGSENVLRYDPTTKRFEMTPEAKTIIGQYQVDELGIPESSDQVGQVGWKTMKSLAGGDTVDTAKFKISRDAVGEIDFKSLGGV